VRLRAGHAQPRKLLDRARPITDPPNTPQVLLPGDRQAPQHSARLRPCHATLDDPDFKELLAQMKRAVSRAWSWDDDGAADPACRLISARTPAAGRWWAAGPQAAELLTAAPLLLPLQRTPPPEDRSLLQRAFDIIDQANSADPRKVDGQGYRMVYGRCGGARLGCC
jgi:hypothetical protein